MATIKDIAKLANVSPATVSNVLNGRGNVSSEKMQLVNEAAVKLGYVINAQAKQLRRDSSLSNNIAIVLPSLHESIYSIFYEGTRQLLEGSGYNVLPFTTNDSIYNETKIINHVAELRVSGVITVSCSINNPSLYTPITSYGGIVIHAYREVTQMQTFVGFDFFEIGRQIGNYIKTRNYKKIGILSESRHFCNSIQFYKGFISPLSKHALPSDNVSIQHEDSDIITSPLVSFDFFKDGTSPDVIVLTNSSFLKDIQLASAVGSLEKAPDIITLDHSSICVKQLHVKRYCLDYTQLGISAAQTLLSFLNEKGTLAANITLRPLGFVEDFPFPSPFVKAGHKDHLKLLIASGESTNALKRILPDFTRQTGLHIDLDENSTDDIYSKTIIASSTGEIDLVRINMSRMSCFDPDMFYHFDDDEFSSLTNGMFPRVIKDFTCINGYKTAIPFDIGTEMLVYRKDLFENPMFKRMYYERYGESLNVPTSFGDFCKVVHFFNHATNPNSPVRSGTTINIDCGSELFSNFILRYLNSSSQLPLPFSDEDICRQCLSDILSNMQECSKAALPIFNQPWIGSSLSSFIHGQTAIEIVFLNYASSIIHLKRSTYGGQIGYAPIPGGRSYITGGALSIYKNSPNIENAKKFIKWISNPAMAELFTTCGGLSPHMHVYDISNIMTEYPWYRHLPETINSGCGRDFWDTIDPENLKRHLAPLLRDICLDQISSEFICEQVFDLFHTFVKPLSS